MNAQEMFKKLGYHYIKEVFDLGVFTYKNGDYEVDFDTKQKIYHCSKEGNMTWETIVIDIELHKAITQQMKELGWIK